MQKSCSGEVQDNQEEALCWLFFCHHEREMSSMWVCVHHHAEIRLSSDGHLGDIQPQCISTLCV